MPSPYSGLPPRSYWSRGVCDQEPGFIADLYRKRYAIERTTRVATAGSCFAQHITRHLRREGYTVIDAEPAPPGLTRDQRRVYGYGVFSARYWNVYTARQMLQLSREAIGEWTPEDIVWAKGERYVDVTTPRSGASGVA